MGHNTRSYLKNSDLSSKTEKKSSKGALKLEVPKMPNPPKFVADKNELIRHKYRRIKMPKVMVSLAQRRRSRSARACAACAPRGAPSFI